MSETTVGSKTRINGTISGTDRLVVRGVVNGEVTGRDKVEIAPDGRMIGDVRTARILISDGAVFKGRVEMDVREG